eukprot:10743563-Alexandrium_andersonii.AAC.1
MGSNNCGKKQSLSLSLACVRRESQSSASAREGVTAPQRAQELGPRDLGPLLWGDASAAHVMSSACKQRMPILV